MKRRAVLSAAPLWLLGAGWAAGPAWANSGKAKPAPPAKPRPPQPKLIALDPGHGGADSGAVGALPVGTDTGLPPHADQFGTPQIFEKDVNLDIALRLNGFLAGRGFPTLMTRNGDNAGGSSTGSRRVSFCEGARPT